MRGRGCRWQVLNAEAANLSRINFFSFGKFSSVGAQGSWGGVCGGRARAGQEHFSVPGWIIPVLVHFVCVDSILEIAAEMASKCVAALGGHDPICGKSAGTTRRPTQAFRLRYKYLTALLTYMSWRVETGCPVAFCLEISTIMPPVKVIGSEEAPSILACRGKIVSGLIWSSDRSDSGQTFIWAPESMMDDLVIDLAGLESFLEKVGTVNPRFLYEGRWRRMVTGMSGLFLGLDLIQPA